MFCFYLSESVSSLPVWEILHDTDTRGFLLLSLFLSLTHSLNLSLSVSLSFSHFFPSFSPSPSFTLSLSFSLPPSPILSSSSSQRISGNTTWTSPKPTEKAARSGSWSTRWPGPLNWQTLGPRACWSSPSLWPSQGAKPFTSTLSTSWWATMTPLRARATANPLRPVRSCSLTVILTRLVWRKWERKSRGTDWVARVYFFTMLVFYKDNKGTKESTFLCNSLFWKGNFKNFLVRVSDTDECSILIEKGILWKVKGLDYWFLKWLLD